MNIGIIGAGNIGLAVAQLAARAGHSVALSNSRGPASLHESIQHLGAHVRATTIEEAAAFGELVLIAIPFNAYQSILATFLGSKIVIDALNYVPQRDGQIQLGGRTSSELVAAHLSGARVVKSFNTLWSRLLETEARPDQPLSQRIVLFMAGDDADAKSIVGQFIEQIGFAPLDTGTLHEGGRLQEPGSAVYNQPLTLEQAHKLLGSAGSH